MTKADTLYRAGYMAASRVDTLSPDFKQLPGEHWNDRNDRLEKIEYARYYGWRFICYAIKAKDTARNIAEYNRGFNDRMHGNGYSLNK